MPIGVVGAIIGASVVGAGATLIAAHGANSAASSAAAQNNALESQIYQSNKALEEPYIQGGDAAESELMAFLGLNGDASATDAAFQKYLNSTGYQFAYNQGLDAVAQSKAAAGMLGSGSLVKALDAYGTGLAQQYGQDYINNLNTVAGRGGASADALAGQGQAYAGQVSANNNSAASARANADLAAGNAVSGLAGNALNAYALSRGLSSYGAGAGGSYNAFAPPGG